MKTLQKKTPHRKKHPTQTHEGSEKGLQRRKRKADDLKKSSRELRVGLVKVLYYFTKKRGEGRGSGGLWVGGKTPGNPIEDRGRGT